MEPYVWILGPSGGVGRKRAPGNLFKETEIYTIPAQDGSRDLSIEHALSALENGLKTLLTDFIAPHRQLPPHMRSRFIAFIAAMHGRTPQAREVQRTLWQKDLDLAERKGGILARTSEQDQGSTSSGCSSDAVVNLDDLRSAVASPMRFLLPGAMADGLPILRQMTLTVMYTDEPGFVTSDSPVTWFDPTLSRDKFLMHKSSLSDPGIEITMPLSPRHAVILHHPLTPSEAPMRYMKANTGAVVALNRRTAFYADKVLVSWRNGFEPDWQIRPTSR
jgi:hypothetical protein